jgi:hypothetical protein
VIAYKYLPCFEEAIKNGEIDAYSIIDLESQISAVSERVDDIALKPENVFYLPDPDPKKEWASATDFEPILKKLIKQKGAIKVFIATELKAHEEYLRYCVENGIDSLVEKPIFAPMKDGAFDPASISSTMDYLVDTLKKKPANHSVMTLARYHSVYNDEILETLKKKMLKYHAPLTSFHLLTNSGVWNLYREYETRGDHPYRDGYGMLMHGAYHYVDLMAQFLNLNKLIFPGESFELQLSSFAAFPSDQAGRIPRTFNEKFEDLEPVWTKGPSHSAGFGETDISTTFCLIRKKTRKVITVGTISLEQTTPSVRSWKDLPEDFYNKNGRVSCTTIEAQLSTIFSIHGRAFKVPIKNKGEIIRVDNYAQVQTRGNASLVKNEKYNSTKVFENYFNSSSNRKLLSAWLKGKERKSQLHEHAPAMHITQALALSIQKPGYPVSINF